jgi:rhodanese-related sulfurtransferase
VVPEIDLPAFAAAHAGGAVVLDVREPFEYANGHVPGAVLMPMAQVHSRMRDVPPGEKVYVICASGNRSYTAAGWLRTAGIDAVSVAGGIGLWAAQGRPLVRGVTADSPAA